MQVAKRDGRVMEFKKERIIDAIEKAMAHTPDGVDEELAKKIACNIEKQLENRDEVSVYEIQDLVEKKLMVSSRKEVATAYITYRYTRDVARKSKTKNVFLDILTSKSGPLTRRDDEYQNINDMMNNFVAESIKPYVDTMLVSKDVNDAERAGYIEIKDKSYYPTKAIRSFIIPLSKDSKILKNCKNVESALISILSVVNKLQGEVCSNIIIPPIDDFLTLFIKRTYDEELQNVIETLGEEQKEKCNALADKETQKRVHNALKFLFEGLSATNKNVTVLENKANYSLGSGVVNSISINLQKIINVAFNYTKDTNESEKVSEETKENIIGEEIRSSLEKYVNIALKGMVERFNFQATGTKRQFPTLMSGMWLDSEHLNDDDVLESVLGNGTLELEVLGIDESIKMLTNKKTMNKYEEQTLKNEIIDLITKSIDNYSKEYKLRITLKETKENEKLEEN